MGTGHVWLVGAGPGDPGLMTIAGQRALEGADVVLYDALVAPALVRSARRGAELIDVGKRAGRHALPQSEIEALIVDRAAAGAAVVRLKGGDPFVFGRGGEEALACRRAGVPCTIVPGVTSAIAAPAYAGIPVTHRGLSSGFMVVTGNSRDDGGDGTDVDWHAAARAGTLVILMGAATLAESMTRLMQEGVPPHEPAACIRWGTRPDQRTLAGTVGTIGILAAEAGLGSPLVTVVGAVAGLAGELAWFAPAALAGRRVVVTRSRAQASELASMLEAEGAEVIEAPVLETRARTDGLIADDRVSSRWDWIVFSSANGVDAFFGALARAGRDARALGTTKVAAIGGATAAALLHRGVHADFQPAKATSAVLAQELPRIQGARVFLPVSARTDDRLATALRARGGLVEQVAAYDTVTLPLDDDLLQAVLDADAITFASASSADNLAAAIGPAVLPVAARLVSIGPETSSAVRRNFGRVDAEAAHPGLPELVDAVRGLPWGS